MGQLQFHGMNDFLESGTGKKQALAEPPCEFLCRYFTITIFLLFYYLLSQIWVPPNPHSNPLPATCRPGLQPGPPGVKPRWAGNAERERRS